MEEANKFCWNELATTDIQAAKDFYGKVFGWTFSDQPMGDFTYTMIMNKDKGCGGMWAIPKDKEKQIPPHWMAYILVDNLEDSLEKACELGASIVKSVTDVGDCGRFAVIVDPTGAHIAMWQNVMSTAKC